MLLFNRYEYNPRTDLIGKGGFSRVYKAFDQEGNVAVALKIYKNTEDAGGEKPIPEKERMLALDHPNICRYLLIEEMEKEDSFGEKESFQVCILEWMEGGDLAGHYKSRRNLVILKKLLEDTVRGLQYLHANGMVHRHVRAANILVRTGSEGAVAKVADFGTGKRAANDESGLITAVQYLAPEQLNVRKYGNQGKVSYNIDYWALGICVYEMMTGDILFRSGEQDSREQIMNNILSPVLPEKINRLPEPFRSMVTACLVKDARDRTREGEELLQILQGEISGEAPVDEEETVKLLKTELPAEEPVQSVLPAEAPFQPVLPMEELVLPVQEEEEVDPDATVLIRRPVIKGEEEPVKEEIKPTEEEVKPAEEEAKPIEPAQEEEEVDPDATVLIRRPVIKEEEEPVRKEVKPAEEVKPAKEEVKRAEEEAKPIESAQEEQEADPDATVLIKRLAAKIAEPVREEKEITTDKEDDRKKVTEEAEEIDEDATVLMARPPAASFERKEPPVTPDGSGAARTSGVSEPLGAMGSSGPVPGPAQPAGPSGIPGPGSSASGSWPPGATGNAAPSGSWPPGASGTWGASGSFASSGTPGGPSAGGAKEDQMSLFNRYQYNPQTGLIGRGGFSRVYKAFDRKLNRWVALKIYKTSEFPERYSPIAEIRRVVNLDHPNICRYLDIEEIEKENTFGEKEITQICVMELLDGGNFAQYITAHKTEEVLKKLVGDVLNGLAYLHRNGIIHRDIKPANILIKETIDGPVAKITDFGISKGSDSVNSNSSSALVVSIPYMAPEQLNVKKYGVQEKISYNLDLWSLGVTIYEVITGKVLFKNNEQDSSEQIMTNIMAPELPEKIKELPEPFRSIVAHCIIKSANERAQKAEELIVLLHSNHTETPVLPLVPLRTAPEVSATTEAPVTAPAAKVSKPSFFIDKPDSPASPPPRIRPDNAQSFSYWKMGLGVVAGAAVAFFLFWFFFGRNSSGSTDLSSQKADTSHAHNPVVNPVPPSPTVAVADSSAGKITKSREQGPDDQAKDDRKKKTRVAEGQDNHTDKPTDRSASRHKTEVAGPGDSQQPYTLELTANKDCRLFINGESQGTIHAGGTMKIFLTAGSYTMKATSTTDNTSYSTSFEIKTANLGQVNHRRLELQ